MVVAPDVDRVERIAFFVVRRRAAEHGFAAGARQAVDDLLQRLAGELLRLSLGRPEAGAPQQPVGAGERQRGFERGDGCIGGRGR